ncbi:MAG TPA: peptidylprolyl isomerase [Verrucomicrobiae bacterium]|jgi:cyclophilin family peptidyl-prolyl cis-trans isomerase
MKSSILEVLLLCFALALKANAQAPSIISQPQSITVNNASDAAFAVNATNAVSYQWYFNGTTPLAGETNATLNLIDVNSNEQGNYTVVATSANSLSATSAPPAVLAVVPGTVIRWIITSPNGSSNSFLVQLFDHDKPATVENIIHYITSGLYSNMIVDRDATNFVLQGGDYTTPDRSSTNLSFVPINPGPDFPSQLESEFGAGPLIHNAFGTVAMALKSGQTNSATSPFYFNTADNSASLDSQEFTVFGRILDAAGSNVLRHFATLTAPDGIFDYSSAISTLPVNYDTTNHPTDANLFYCEFAFVSPSGPPVDANTPAVSITSPADGAVLTGTNSVTVQGTAQGLGLAEVYIVLTPQPGGTGQTNLATGTGNWSVNLGYPAGTNFQLAAYAMDGGGNLSVPAIVNFTSQIPPIIETQPANATFVAGSSATFSVGAVNAAGYQWQLVGSGPISGATNSTLVLPNVTANMSGNSYEVVVTAPDGQTQASAPATLTVIEGTLVQITFSGFPDGSTSNVMVQLYDREKPVTVANFLRYITPAYYFGLFPGLAFSNMVWDRCVPGFILQGGDYDADPSISEPPTQLGPIGANFTDGPYSPPFAAEVHNEYNTGPVLSNTFGTLAMATVAGFPDSASHAFFFNLADNSAALDSQNGGYTVFGRVISGSNVLQYFNTLSKPNAGIFDSSSISTDLSRTDLPVNDRSFNQPANSNLFYGSFTLLSSVTPDTTPPTLAVTSMTNGQTFPGADVTIEGTASDDVGLANVSCACTGSNFFSSPFAFGSTNWSVDLGFLPPGLYTNIVTAQDGSGNKSAAVSNTFIVPFVPYSGTVTGNGTLSTNIDGAEAILGNVYSVTAKAGKGAVFVNWVSGTNASLIGDQQFTMANGTTLTANFISNTAPGSITFKSPASFARFTNGNVAISGKISPILGAAQVTCWILDAYTGRSLFAPAVMNATNAWSTPVLPIPPGLYYAQVIAQGAKNRSSVAYQIFSVLAPLTVIVHGRGTPTITNGAYLEVGVDYTESMTPPPGETLLSWNTGSGSFQAGSFPFAMTPGFTITATLVSNTLPHTLTITAPALNARVTNPSITLAGKIAATVAQPHIVCQLFQNSLPFTGFVPATVSGTSWTLPVSNLTMGIFDAVAMATDASGKTTVAEQQFVVNYFASLAGSYKGLFLDPTNIAATNAGYISFQLSPLSPLVLQHTFGMVAGSLAFPGRSYPFSVKFSNLGSAAAVPIGLDGVLDLSLNITNFSGIMTGSLIQGGDSVPFTAYRTLSKLATNTVIAPGHYALDLQPQTPANSVLDGPPGDSFATVIASAAGNLAVAGTMADNSTFSQSTGVFTNGAWPLFAKFYAGKGMLIGWETNLPSGESSGSLYWIKAAKNGTYYTNGLGEQLISAGTNYAAPKPPGQFTIVLGGGTLATPITNQFSFNAAGTIVPAAGTLDQLKGSVLLSTGVVKGSIVNPVNKKALSFAGVFVGQAQGGSGFTLDANGETGYFDIAPAGP